MENFDLTKFLIILFSRGICLGIAFWLSVKIVDRENRQNTIISALIYGIILQALLFVPLAGIVVAFMVLAFIFRSLDLELGEIAVACFIITILYISSIFLTNWIIAFFY